MNKIYKTEELIYESITDISDKYGMGKNVFRIRVVRRVEVKPKNFFRKVEKEIVYYDIEYLRPNCHYLKSTDSFIPSVNSDNENYNRPLEKHNDNIHEHFKGVMWNAENFCLKYKTKKMDSGIIRKIHIF